MQDSLRLTFFSLFFFLFSGIRAQDKSGIVSKEVSAHLKDKLEVFFGDRDKNDPGAVLIIKQGEEIIYKNKFGKSNLETNTDITYETVFEAASVSKQFTAAAILHLEEEGKLNLSDDVHVYIPELPDYGHKITLQHLLTHTSGLKDWRNITYLYSLNTATRLYTQDMALEIICGQRSLNFKPGEQYRYSNAGYDLLGTIVERVSGQPFDIFIKENFLNPAGMKNSFMRGKYTDIVKNRATGYLTKDGKYQQGVVLDETHGAAGLYSTPEDLEKWNEYIFSDRVTDHFKQLRLTRFKLNNGILIPYANGGVEVNNYKGNIEINHGGLISGYRAWLAYYPESKISVAYMSNDRNIMTTELSKTINKALFGEIEKEDTRKPLEVSSEWIEKMQGIYVNTNDLSDYLELKENAGELFNFQKQVEFASKNKFLIDGSVFSIQKNKIIKKTPTGIFNYKKVEKASLTPGQFATYTGLFNSIDSTISFLLYIQEEKLVVSRANYDTAVLLPVYQDGKSITFRGLTNGLRALFHFTIQKDKSVDLHVSLPRADVIPFFKQKD